MSEIAEESRPEGPGRGASPRTRRKAVAAAIVLGLAGSACDHGPPRQHVRLVEGPRAEGEPRNGGSRDVLRIGVASVLSSAGSLRYYRELIDYLGEKLGMPTEMVQRPSYSEMNELLRQRYCTAGFLCNYAFVRAEREFGAEILAAPVVNGDPRYRAYIIAARDGPVRSLLDLEGRRFAFEDPMCNAGWLYPSYLILKLGHSPRRFFGSEIFTYDYRGSIRAVGSGAADGAGVESPLYDSLVAAGDTDAVRTRIIVRSPPFGAPPVAVHPGLDRAVRERLRRAFLELDESERGREILSNIEVDRFVEPGPDLYASVRAMADAVDRP